ncbi:hypothetical protein [Rhizobium mayense]|uniref:Band 7 domain-containing protein n=1 Tax=Rhizobium mayense TaxID=1312184 RepID=A0ABT7K0X1_9HYPH|nr:hypothetical protein [Rhizobium mayense]MDL2400804.1 hypothetical protein [Rhizobium mayense]
MPEIYLKTLLLIPVAIFFGLIAILQVGGVTARFVQIVIFTLAAFRTSQGISRIWMGSRTGVLTVGPQGIIDRRFGGAIIPWPAIDRIDLTAQPEVRPIAGRPPIARVVYRTVLRSLAASGICGDVDIPRDLGLTEYRDQRAIRMWLRTGEHIEQTTAAARLNIRDSANGTQRISIKVADLNASRGEILMLIAALHQKYGEHAAKGGLPTA